MKRKHSARFIKKWLDKHNLTVNDVMRRFALETANEIFFLLARFTVNDYKRWLL